VTERGVSEVVHDRGRLARVRRRTEPVAEPACELRDLERVRQARAEVVRLARSDDAGRALEAAERAGVDQPVEVALERVPVVRRIVAVRMSREVVRPVAVLRSHPHRPLRASEHGPFRAPHANGGG
jgi:hypothetical protein